MPTKESLIKEFIWAKKKIYTILKYLQYAQLSLKIVRLKKTSHIDNVYGYYQLTALKHSGFNLYQRISSSSLGKEKVESKFISINGD